MSYELRTEQKENNRLVRTYTNQQGTEVKTYHIYDGPDKIKYWGFVDLYNIPIQRVVMSKHIADLFGIGLSKVDIIQWCSEEKRLLKSNDPEKYEKLFALILEKEKIVNMVADPIKQHLALCTVYILKDDERVDYFNEEMATEKIKQWSAFPAMTAFFLSWHNDNIRRYMGTLQKISRTVSTLQKREQRLPLRKG